MCDVLLYCVYCLCVNVWCTAVLCVNVCCTAVLCVLREERRLRVFENRVLRIVFGPKREEVTGNGESYIMRN
jgi:hypothetical protein